MLKDYIVTIVNACGPRITGSEPDRKAIGLVKGFMGRSCDRVDVEEFDVAPRVLQRLTEIITYAVLAVFIAFFISPALSLVIGLVFGTLFFLSRWYDREIIDRCMEKKKTANVIGTVRPSGETRQRLIVSGHHDSAFNMTLLHRQFVWLMPILEFFTTVSMLVMLALSVYAMIRGELVYPFVPGRLWTGALMVGFFGAVTSQIMRKGLVTDIETEGANDNLSSVAVAVGLADYLGSHRPINTEVMCISFGAEEPNTKGSQHFVRKHMDTLKAVPTYVLNFDMVGEDGTLRIVKREYEVRSRHSGTFVDFVRRVAQKSGINARPGVLPFGNTDATPFSRKGLAATSLVRLDKTGLPGHWHTVEDTVKNIREESLRECMELALAVLEAMDMPAAAVDPAGLCD
ncbi:MAG: M28 family metallopeptidase [Deltaproteobacteria bacterium]|nr:M28 family metallopeptidase [Deltaproteobacteria bacterium]MCL5277970.1 M28 family metallopeptidase [Deltaproteobacteria bacterium]